MPAIVDRAPADGGEPLAMFESGAILIYLAEKVGKFMPRDMRARFDMMQWLMWQMSGLGPMLGQNGHFLLYAPEKISYAIDRYGREARRLYGVLDAHLGEGCDYIAGDYSIADMACFPWIMTHKAQGMTLDDFPHVKRWYALLRARPQLQAGLAVGKGARAPMDEQARKIMFGTDAPAHSAQQQ
jgi:GST-like protein